MQIRIKLESHFPFPFLHQLNSTGLTPSKQLNLKDLGIKAFSLKKKNKVLFTLLSSPHVYKKSREQYKLNFYRTFLILTIKNMNEYKKFLQFKTNLYSFSIDQGAQISFTYKKPILIKGFLPN